LDPGHGEWIRRGAIVIMALKEKDVVLEVASEVIRLELTPYLTKTF